MMPYVTTAQIPPELVVSQVVDAEPIALLMAMLFFLVLSIGFMQRANGKHIGEQNKVLMTLIQQHGETLQSIREQSSIVRGITEAVRETSQSYKTSSDVNKQAFSDAIQRVTDNTNAISRRIDSQTASITRAIETIETAMTTSDANIRSLGEALEKQRDDIITHLDNIATAVKEQQASPQVIAQTKAKLETIDERLKRIAHEMAREGE